MLGIEKPIKDALIQLIEENAPDSPVTVPTPYYDEGLVYGELRRVPELGNRLYLTDSINGPNNPQCCSLENLTASNLFKALCAMVNARKTLVLKEYQSIRYLNELTRLAYEASRIIELSARVERYTPLEVATQYIYEALCLQGQVNAWKPEDEEREFLRLGDDCRLPYIITLDGLCGFTISQIREFKALRILSVDKGGQFVTEPYGIHGEPLAPEETILVSRKRIAVRDNRTQSQTEYTYIPDEAVFLIEDSIDYESRKM